MQGPTRPAPSPMPAQGDWEGWGELRMGKKGYREFETIKRDERQRGEQLAGGGAVAGQ